MRRDLDLDEMTTGTFVTRLLVGVSLVAAFDELAGVPLLEAQPPRSRGVIDGMVSDTNLVALGDAGIAVLGSGLHVTTGENGRFRVVAIPSGQYILTVHRVGYVPVAAAIQVGDADTLRLSFAMRRIATELDTVVVSAKALVARMDDFEERRKLGFGTFITAEQIEQRRSVVLGEVLRGIPSLNVVDSGPNEYAFSTRTGNNTCPMQVVIDNVLLPTPTNLRSLLPPADIMGIEVYSGAATIPLQFKTANSGCGMILIWTK
jgi:hypothetical protein